MENRLSQLESRIDELLATVDAKEGGNAAPRPSDSGSINGKAKDP